MSYPLGAIVPLSITVMDSSGTATNATVAITVTLPDGTTAHPAVQTSGTGQYYVDYLAPQAGRYEVYWTTSGAVTSAYGPDAFEIAPTSRAPLISLADAKAHLNASSSTTNDAEMLWMLNAATDAIEADLGRVLRRTTVTETFDGGRTMVRLRRTPCPCLVCGPSRILSVTQITENGQTLGSSDWTLDYTAGVIYRGGGVTGGVQRWLALTPQSVSVTYVTGYTMTPPWAQLAVKRCLEGLWTRTQQRPHPGYGQAPDVDYAPAASAFVVNNAIQELIAPHKARF